uniref:Uncharacterized protein n=1 Tax=Columba livia TaxID=8932 RepID=R7VRQ9_COLLI
MCVCTHALQVVVEVDAPGAQVAAQQRGVRGEDGGHGQAARAAQHQPQPRQPLVETPHDERPLLALRCKLTDKQGVTVTTVSPSPVTVSPSPVTVSPTPPTMNGRSSLCAAN